PRATRSAETASGAHAEPADPSALDTWRSETGTWRTRGTAETGSWRMPPSSDLTAGDARNAGDAGKARDGADTGERRTHTPPETGSWSRSRGQWVPPEDTGEQPNFTVRRFDDTGEISKEL